MGFALREPGYHGQGSQCLRLPHPRHCDDLLRHHLPGCHSARLDAILFKVAPADLSDPRDARRGFLERGCQRAPTGFDPADFVRRLLACHRVLCLHLDGTPRPQDRRDRAILMVSIRQRSSSPTETYRDPARSTRPIEANV
ncbi:MAG: hypothetical protein MZV64_59555 [Ignavibacteriales bacterium]|nr:hypothetical protein [Ignavibacteriales bacterium]